jgi:hypothetical protein
MKTLFILIIFISSIIQSCEPTETKLFNTKQTIDYSTVDFITIRSKSEPGDTSKLIDKRLSNEQAQVFVEKWNHSEAIGPCKFVVLYWIDINFKDGSKRTFRVNGKTIKEQADFCFEFNDDKFIETLWTKIK